MRFIDHVEGECGHRDGKMPSMELLTAMRSTTRSLARDGVMPRGEGLQAS